MPCSKNPDDVFPAGESLYRKPLQINGGILPGAANVMINGGTFINNQDNSIVDDPCMKLLRSNTAAGAFHNSDDRRDPPKCHPHTREAVIKDIMDWVIDTNRKEQFCWIYGPAGSGKSSIAQTIAEMCEQQGRLASDFFFARTMSGRNTHTHLIPTLAYQLAISIPDIRKFIVEAISFDGLIFTRSLPTQLDAIILKPLARLISLSGTSQPNLVIIDGLDECNGDQNQTYILSSLSSALERIQVPLIFLIASRPEHAIRVAFNGSLNKLTRRLVLDDKYHPDVDIRRYLNSQFAEIQRVHPLGPSIPSDWPAASDLDSIVKTASGQFIYASTVIKFIKSHRDRPTKRLDIILNLRPPEHHTPFADLDALYRHILLSLEGSVLEMVLSLFAFLFAIAKINTEDCDMEHLPSIRSPEFIEEFLDYESGDLHLALADLHSIVDVPCPKKNNWNKSGQLRLFHASLGDFLLDKRRSGSLYINMDVYHTRFAIKCMSHLAPWLYLTVHVETLQRSLEAFSRNPDLAEFSWVTFSYFLTALDVVNEDILYEISKFPVNLLFERILKGPRNYQESLNDLFANDNCFSTQIPRLFEWAQRKHNLLHIMFSEQYLSQIRKLLRFPIDKRTSCFLTGFALTVTMVFDVPAQQRSNDLKETAGLMVPVTTKVLPLSHYTHLSVLDQLTTDGWFKYLQHVPHNINLYLNDHFPRVMQYEHWSPIHLNLFKTNYTDSRKFSHLHQIHHYLRVVHVLTHDEHSASQPTADNSSYLVDVCKVSDFAIYLYDSFTLRNEPPVIHPHIDDTYNQYFNFLADLFCFALKLIPGDSSLSDYLCDNCDKPFELCNIVPSPPSIEKKVRSAAAEYIQEYKQHAKLSSDTTSVHLKRARSASPSNTEETD